ncbi:hypothetical protein [Paraburkholderia kirstenboschensis]|uniref:Uncharacterized protein n=1 Tax=Paraburkholderia kirstenboschensis TaxID=1245436 RepID=A0ABZ0ERG7_9BURK|nr:hypothetical protein [Paraburkholderia kirstenboschensis]WOD19515.1 hypothetical protein RW095_25100 [Paraburkholderia kirstenboschensis]
MTQIGLPRTENEGPDGALVELWNLLRNGGSGAIKSVSFKRDNNKKIRIKNYQNKE